MVPPAESPPGWRPTLVAWIRQQAQPTDKFSHQVRLYRLAREIGAGIPHDDDILFAAAWLHDLGVFVGHRPEEPEALARWDHVAYTCARTPAILAHIGFPESKVPGVLEAIRAHQPQDQPTTPEGVLLRDADLLEQLGAAAILRTAAKAGRDTRFPGFAAVLQSLAGNLERLPTRIALDRTRTLAAPRIAALKAFLEAAHNEAPDADWQ